MRTNIDYSRLTIFRYVIHLIRKLRKVDIGIVPPFTFRGGLRFFVSRTAVIGHQGQIQTIRFAAGFGCLGMRRFSVLRNMSPHQAVPVTILIKRLMKFIMTVILPRMKESGLPVRPVILCINKVPLPLILL